MIIFPQAEQRINPYPFYMNMRNLHPIEYDDNSSAWGVFRYKDIENILNVDVEMDVESPYALGQDLNNHLQKQWPTGCGNTSSANLTCGK
jgi:hypothetical protein